MINHDIRTRQSKANTQKAEGFYTYRTVPYDTVGVMILHVNVCFAYQFFTVLLPVV